LIDDFVTGKAVAPVVAMALVVRSVGPLAVSDGTGYMVRICGRQRPDGVWEGWVEFEPDDGSPALRTPRETTQPKLTDLQYWATGLTETYLEGALERARQAEATEVELEVPEVPAYEGPAPAASTRAAGGDADDAAREEIAEAPHAVLDPFSVYRKGEDLLRRQLGALSARHLRGIVLAYRLASVEDIDLEMLDTDELIEIIVGGVRERLAA
jgi:hypothetical protein